MPHEIVCVCVCVCVYSEFKCSYSEIRDANVMRNDRRLAEENVFVLRTELQHVVHLSPIYRHAKILEVWLTPLLRKICKMPNDF